MDFTKLILGDALGDVDLAGLNVLGFNLQDELLDDDPGTLESGKVEQSQDDRNETSFKLPVLYSMTIKDVDMTENVYKFSDLFTPQSFEPEIRSKMMTFLNQQMNDG